MRYLKYTLIVALLFLLSACGSYTFDCSDLPLQPVFIGYNSSEVDTLYFRRYQANTNYTTIVGTDTVSINKSLTLYTRHDSIDINTYGVIGISAGADWELVIPAVNKTIRINNIVSEKRQGKCGKGIFSMDKVGCDCFNPIYSATTDNQLINFSNGNTILYFKK